MPKKLFILLTLSALFAGGNLAVAASVPAGTRFSVSMADALSTHERPGRAFKAQLTQDISSGGKVLLPAGTMFYGVVETSRNSMVKTTTSPMTLNLTSVAVNGKRVPVKTTGAATPGAARAATTRQARADVSVGRGVLQHGSQLEFQLAQPINM